MKLLLVSLTRSQDGASLFRFGFAVPKNGTVKSLCVEHRWYGLRGTTCVLAPNQDGDLRGLKIAVGRVGRYSFRVDRDRCRAKALC
jgi:hypothetical protein